jgi:hypothetical protein
VKSRARHERHGASPYSASSSSPGFDRPRRRLPDAADVDGACRASGPGGQPAFSVNQISGSPCTPAATIASCSC